MKNVILIIVVLTGIMACKKEGINNDSRAQLHISSDSLHFDTVFTSVGSVTKYLVLINPNSQTLILNNISLTNGASSHFAVNVNGSPLTDAYDVRIPAGDSIYIFVAVTIQPTTEQLPFIIEDSLRFSYNGNNKFVRFTAYGQNATFLHNYTLKEDEVWGARLPYVITGKLTIPNSRKLTIQKGAALYMHADAAITVNGSLQVQGTANEKVQFAGNRLDRAYKNLPGSWPGIVFNAESANNSITHANIKNAVNAISVKPSEGTATVLQLDGVSIDNNSGIALQAQGSRISASNCLITNSGTNIAITAGGYYTFEQTTIAAFDNGYVNRKAPVVSISNLDEEQKNHPLSLSFTNSIIWGDHQNIPDELSFQVVGNPTVVLDHTIYKAENLPSYVQLQNSIANQDPLFDSINTARKVFDFSIGKQSSSPSIGTGKPLLHITEDITGAARVIPFDLGCYKAKGKEE